MGASYPTRFNDANAQNDNGAVTPHAKVQSARDYDTAGLGGRFEATANAAEQWRTSWRKRHLAASPVALRAAVAPRQPSAGANRGFKVGVGILTCMIVALTIFIASTSLPAGGQGHGTPVTFQAVKTQPMLVLQSPLTSSVTVGSTLALHGEGFHPSATINFLLDGLSTIQDASGQPLTTQVSAQGTFDMNIPVVASNWSSGSHFIQAEDRQDKQSGYLSLRISQVVRVVANSSELALSESYLSYLALYGHGSPPEQFVALTNTSTAPLNWQANASMGTNLSWLAVEETNAGGVLAPGATTSVGVIVNVAGLALSDKPYNGQVFFTLNEREQVALPVSLSIHGAADEMVISPNPLVGVLTPNGNSCQPKTFLTFANLSSASVTWDIVLNPAAQPFVTFTNAGNPVLHGVLAPAGQPGATFSVELNCTNVHNGNNFLFTVFANGNAWQNAILIQETP